MVQTSQSTKSTQRVFRAGKRSRTDRNWTLLFIGDHGRVINLKRFKVLLVLVGLVLGGFIAAALGLYLFSQKILSENKQLETELKTFAKQLKDLRHEKEVLMTRLVLAEAREKETLGGGSEHPVVTMAENQVDAAPQEPNPPAAAPEVEPMAPAVAHKEKESEAPLPEQSNAEPEIAQAESQLSVLIDDFRLTRLAGDNSVKAQFKLKNTSPNSQRVSGHIFVVLKGDQIDSQHWVSIPRATLQEGKPTGRDQGHSFGINNYKTIRLRTVAPQSLEKFQTATVYVFGRNGELLLEQDFAINLPASDGSSATPTPSGSASQISGEFSME
jgi:hypothetical protein